MTPHDARALDATLRRFPRLIRLARHEGWNDPHVIVAVMSAKAAIVAEYNAVLGKEVACTRSC